MRHVPVLLNETVDGLMLATGDVFVDGTLGSAGHSEEVCRRFGTQVTIIGIDQDQDAIERSTAVLTERACRFSVHKANFSEIRKVLDEAGVSKANKILLDLGVSSHQIDEAHRGFSFQQDGPLLMTMVKNPGPETVTASDVVNNWEENNIADILYGFGDERFSRRIAKAIVAARKKGEITTTKQLADIVIDAVPGFYKRGKIHPATKTFQALRIAVNDETGHLSKGLEESIECLESKGRIAVITFHSLEDRIVKRFFKEAQAQGKVRIETKKPIVPSEEEIATNPRSRSAKLRIAEKL